MLSHFPDVHQICAASEGFRATMKTGKSDTKERGSAEEGVCMTLGRLTQPQALWFTQFWRKPSWARSTSPVQWCSLVPGDLISAPT